MKEAIKGPLKEYWYGQGNGDIPDGIIYKELKHILPEIFIRENLEKRQISERGCLSLLNEKFLLKERGLVEEKDKEKAATEQRKIVKAQRATEIQLEKLEREKREALRKALEDALSPEAKQKKLETANKRADTKARKAGEKMSSLQAS